MTISPASREASGHQPVKRCEPLASSWQPWPKGSSTTLATALVVVSYWHRLQFGPLDQAQRNTEVMKPFLQFTVHNAPFREKLATY